MPEGCDRIVGRLSLLPCGTMEVVRFQQEEAIPEASS